MQTQTNRWEEPMPSLFRKRMAEMHGNTVRLEAAIDKEAKLVGYIENNVVVERETGERFMYHWSSVVINDIT